MGWLSRLLLGTLFGKKIVRRKSSRRKRREYYNEYLKSDEWKRKRYVVLKRDNWKCKYCGAKATQVHHLKYAKYQIGKEPIKWLVSVCASCHKDQH
jgi:5-methylcytosine-specific restriction endonuclease McrA